MIVLTTNSAIFSENEFHNARWELIFRQHILADGAIQLQGFVCDPIETCRSPEDAREEP
jgi:hypothetical protein